MRDSTEASRCQGCGTEYYSTHPTECDECLESEAYDIASSGDVHGEVTKDDMAFWREQFLSALWSARSATWRAGVKAKSCARGGDWRWSAVADIVSIIEGQLRWVIERVESGVDSEMTTPPWVKEGESDEVE